MKRTNTTNEKRISRLLTRAAGLLIAGCLLAAVALPQETVRSEPETALVASPESTTVTFGNSAAITINDNAAASPYPSQITVSGVNPAYVTNVRVSVSGFSHTFPDDVDMMLVGPRGQRAMLMSDAGGGNPGVFNVTVGFDMTAASDIPDASLAAGLFRPKNYADATLDNFPALTPAASPDETADLSIFNGTDPNGVWSLYVVDDAGQDTGLISGGWQLRLTVPTVFTVNSAADTTDGVCDAANCTLREAITAALAAPGADDLINFSPLFGAAQTIELQTALPDLTESLTIVGPGASLLTVRRAYNAATNFRIFNIPGGAARVSIGNLTVAGGSVDNVSLGGGILSFSSLTLTGVHVTGNRAGGGGGVNFAFADGLFANCTFSGNVSTNPASSGGGIFYQGDGGHTLRLVNSTVSGNVSANEGGGIINISVNGSARLDVINSTITGNTAPSGGGGILNFTQASATAAAVTTLRNTIVAGNSSNNLATETANGGPATIVTNGFNLSDNYNGVLTPLATDVTAADARLAPLAFNGGAVPTHALYADSPALDKGNASGFGTDARGLTRPFDAAGVANASDGADIGAIEMQVFPVSNAADSGAGSLRQALTDAPANSDIVFAAPLFNSPQTIGLQTVLPEINRNLTFVGPGANLLTVRRAANAATNFRVFGISAGAVSFTGLTITNGFAPGSDEGGGIRSLGRLFLTNVAVANNRAGRGGGVSLIFADSWFTGCTFSGNAASEVSRAAGGILFDGTDGHTPRIDNSTVSGNSSASSGGGIINISSNGSSRVELVSSTVTGNTAAGFGSGLLSIAQNNATATAVMTLRNTIVANNGASNLATLLSGGAAATIATNGFNLSNNYNGVLTPLATDVTAAAPGLAPLALNGGTVPTHALVAGSPALDKGNASGLTVDGRGLRRPVDLAALANASDGADIGAVEAQAMPPRFFDFDGDGKTDISIFRPNVGEWWINRSASNVTVAAQFGLSTDIITPGDFTGDGKTDIAFFRPSTGFWFILRSEDGSFFSFPFGTSGDVPVPADYDGDGKTDAAVFRPSNATWYINQSSGAGTAIVQFGAASDKPVTADYDGDGKADVGIFRPSDGSWWFVRSSDNTFRVYRFGVGTDKPVQGDWTGDGKADIAVFRPGSGEWFVQRSEDGSFFSFPFGAAGDTPVPGDYDGDGKFDAGVFRSSATTWYISRSTAGLLIASFGAAGDRVVPGAFVP